MSRPRVLGIVLAGGRGSRLAPLTDARAKPALAFGGTHRLVDFALSNLANSGLRDVWVVEQYLPHTLNDHLAGGRPWDLDGTHGGLRVLPPFRSDDAREDGFAEGNADALARNAALIRAFAPDVVVTLSADHVFKLDAADLVARHLELGAGVTMGVTECPERDPSRFAVVGVGAGDRVERFDYKPERPETLPGGGRTISTEAFAYDAARLLRFLKEREGDDLNDYGHELLPELVGEGGARAFRAPGYWRDAGTIESYWGAHMDLLSPDGDPLGLDDPAWPVRTRASGLPPARIAPGARVDDALLAPGSRVAGAVRRSVVGRLARVEAGAEVEDSVLLDGAVVRAGVRVRRAIVGPDETAGENVDGGEGIAVHVRPNEGRGEK